MQSGWRGEQEGLGGREGEVDIGDFLRLSHPFEQSDKFKLWKSFVRWFQCRVQNHLIHGKHMILRNYMILQNPLNLKNHLILQNNLVIYDHLIFLNHTNL